MDREISLWQLKVSGSAILVTCYFLKCVSLLSLDVQRRNIFVSTAATRHRKKHTRASTIYPPHYFTDAAFFRIYPYRSQSKHRRPDVLSAWLLCSLAGSPSVYWHSPPRHPLLRLRCLKRRCNMNRRVSKVLFKWVVGTMFTKKLVFTKFKSMHTNLALKSLKYIKY